MAERTSRKALADALRQRIRSGHYPLGSRLPTHRELLAEFRASPATLQHAFDHLVAQGYVTATPKQGTFVAARLPERTCYGLVFEQGAANPVNNRFWSTLARESQEWADAHGSRFDCYAIADSRTPGTDLARLCADVADSRLAGLVFASGPYHLLGTPAAALLAADLPRVCFGSGEPVELQRYRASILALDGEAAIDASFRWFATQKRRRIAGITSPMRAANWRTHLPALHRAGLETRDCWWIGFPPLNDVAEAVRVTTRLLFDRRPHERPDALLIDDDNLVPWVTAGLAQSGLALPAELSVAAHANFPAPTVAAVPCRRYGFDAQRLLACALDELALLREDGPRRLTTIPARFADEPEGSWDPAARSR